MANSWGKVGAVLLIEAGCVGTLLLGDLSRSVPLFFVAYAVAFLGYVIAIGTSETRSLGSVLVWGMLFRSTVLLSDPSLSDDVYRYLWDGMVQLGGINPYLYAPNAQELSAIDARGLLDKVNHPALPTIYPPLAQLFFRVCSWVAPEPWTIKLGLCLLDGVTLLFLAGLARSYDLPPSVTLVFFWNPLVILEGAAQAHIDLMGVTFLVVALLYIRLHGYGRAGVALALGALTKLLPLLMVPVFWRWAATAEADGKPVGAALFSSRAILIPVAFTATFATGYLLFADAGWRVVGSLGTYASSWEFNAPLYGVLRAAGFDGDTARLVLATVLMVAVAAIVFSRMPPIQGAYFIVGTYLAVTPTLHPWYAVWIVPFLCFYGNRGWIAFSGLIVLAYTVLIRYREAGEWAESAWVTWGIVLGALAVWWGPRCLARTKKEGSPRGDPS